ncbi:hypothetical protein [Qipengyuania gaetbuli]|uniref:hypothetical protein n=1 Tax=Qipengyuania gaetbuli TaxID=266952 RepID=UPI001CFCADC7|nr:hypothetical protein [Qipengyuania gaetbuli]
MKLAKPFRFSVVSLVCVLLAAGLGFQSAGIALTSKAPATAANLFPLNGLAQENFASDAFASSVAFSKEPEAAARSVEVWARSSYLREPLTPESHAILALAEAQGRLRTEIVNLASRLNRREASLQGLVLQEQVLADNYPGAVGTIDEILRVRPSRSTELFPVLIRVFIQDGAVEEFSRVIDGSSPWHQRFLSYAIGQSEALQNLVELRSRQSFGDQELDKALLRNFASEGDLDASFALYRQLSETAHGGRTRQVLRWVSTFEPFDWRFIDTADFRAQKSQESEELELYIRPGNGGQFAERIIEAPDTPFSISASHRISPSSLSNDVKIVVTCADSDEPISEAGFRQSGLSLSVSEVPSACQYVKLALLGRAWSGQSALRGAISPLTISSAK